MSIWREEAFGPVVAVRIVDRLDAVIDAVNDSSYGLSAAIFRSSIDASARFQREADAGQVAVNPSTSGWDVRNPFGDSGSVFTEQGLEGLRFYTRMKTIAVRANA